MSENKKTAVVITIMNDTDKPLNVRIPPKIASKHLNADLATVVRIEPQKTANIAVQSDKIFCKIWATTPYFLLTHPI